KPAWAGLLVALIGLITLSITALTMQMHHTRQRADQQKQAALMLSGLLQGIGPQLALARSSVEVRRLLDESTARVENEFPADSEVAIELLTTIGRSWMAV